MPGRTRTAYTPWEPLSRPPTITHIVAVGNHGRGVVAPCGRDRQVLADYHPGVRVIVPTPDGDAVLLLHGRTVSHLGHDGRLTEHVPPTAATVLAGELHTTAEHQ